MKLKTTIAAFILAMLPGLAFANCGWKTEQTANACADGQVFDADTDSCITPATS